MANILVVDDDEDFAEATATVLREDGHEVEVCLDIEKGLDAVSKRRPDLLVLDVMFPEDASAGFEAAREVRKSGQEYEDMPVLILTAINQRFPLNFGTDQVDDHWLPVSDFVEKPVNFEVLCKKVDDLLQKPEEVNNSSSPV